MAQVQPLAGNPFALMMHPDDVLQAVERSNHLGGLQRRVCRPLDRPLIPTKGKGRDLDAFDREIEAAADESAAEELGDTEA